MKKETNTWQHDAFGNGLLAILSIACQKEEKSLIKSLPVKSGFITLTALQSYKRLWLGLDTAAKHLNVKKNEFSTQLTVLRTALPKVEKQITDGQSDQQHKKDSLEGEINAVNTRLAPVNAEITAFSADKDKLNKNGGGD